MKVRRAVGWVAAGSIVLGGGVALPLGDYVDGPRTISPAAGGGSNLPQFNLTKSGPMTVLAAGKQNGTQWELVGYETKGARYCTEYRLGKDGAHGGFVSCALYVPELEALSALRGFFSTHTDIAPVVGAIARDVSVVQIELDDGRMVEADIYEAAGSSSADFFLAFPPAGVGGSVVASNGEAVVERDPLEVCRPQDVLVSSCGHRAPDGFDE